MRYLALILVLGVAGCYQATGAGMSGFSRGYSGAVTGVRQPAPQYYQPQTCYTYEAGYQWVTRCY